MSLSQDLLAIVPELILALGAIAVLMLGVFTKPKSSGTLSAIMAILMLVALGGVVSGPDLDIAFHGAFVTNAFTRFAKILVLLAGAGSIGLAARYYKDENPARFELPVLISLAALGMMIMISAGDFLSLYLGMELQSLALYVMAAFDKKARRSSEAGLKYFVLGALSSGIMLYGISLIYGFTGTIGFHAMANIVHPGTISVGLIFGLVFLIAGFAFKLSAVPFHMWAPDVYEGAPTPVVAFFATSAKVAALAMTIRALMIAFPHALEQWQQIIVFISCLSMILGGFAGVAQKNIKRLMAYSSIGHMGYALLGLAAGTSLGVQGMLIYLAFYAITTLGAFAAIQAMVRGGEKVESIHDLAGLARTRPRMAFLMAALFLSLAGLPPLMGIFAKLFVFMAAIAAHLYVAAIIGILTSCVAAFYYLRIVKIIYLDEPAGALDTNEGWVIRALVGITGVISLLFVFLPGPVVSGAAYAAKALLL